MVHRVLLILVLDHLPGNLNDSMPGLIALH